MVEDRPQRLVGVADQMVSSVTNVGALFAIAANATANEFGAASVAFALSVIVIAIGRGVVCEPLLVAGVDNGPDHRPVTAAISAVAAALGVAGSLAVPSDSPLRSLVLVIAIALPGLLLLDALRYEAFARRDAARALRLDLEWLVLAVCTAAALAMTNHITPTTLLFAWALPPSVCVLLRWVPGPTQLRAGVREWVQRRSNLSGPFLVDGTIGITITQSTTIALAWVTSLATTAEIRALHLAFAPPALAYAGLYPVTMARLGHDDDRIDRLRRATKGLLFLVVVVHALWTAWVVALPAAVLDTMFGESLNGDLIGRKILFGCVVTVQLAAAPLVMAVRAGPRPEWAPRARLFAAAPSLVLPLTGAAVGGVTGYAAGAIAAGTCSVVVWGHSAKTALNTSSKRTKAAT